jgi:hypothetical protein
MRTYWYINQCKDNPAGRRPSFHAEYAEQYPELRLTEQNFVDRKIDKMVDFNRPDIVLISRENKNSTSNRYSSSLDP